MHASFRRSLAAAAAVGALVGTLSTAEALKVAPTDDDVAPTGPSKVRLVNATVDAGPLELWVDGKKTAGGAAAYKKSSTWIKIAGGKHKLEAFPVKAKGTGTPVYSLDDVWTANVAYTVFVCGTLAEPSSATLEHDTTAPAAGKARVRFFHGAPGLEVVDAAFTDGPTIGERISYASNSGYVDADPGKWELVLKRAGYDEALHTFPSVEVKKGKIYTLVVAGPEAKREVFGIPEP